MDAAKLDRKWDIYTLSDPRDGAVRYVGVTHCGARRYGNHVSEALRGRRGHKCTWIRLLLGLGLLPKRDVVETGAGEWKGAEILWIKRYRDSGCDLTNATDGGQGMVGHSPSAETRAKKSAALKGKPVGPYSPERVAACRAGRKDYRVSPETRAKMRLLWDSPEYRAKLAEAQRSAIRKPWSEARRAQHAIQTATMKGRTYSDETLARMSAGHKGKKLSPEHSAAIGAGHVGHKDSPESRERKSVAAKRWRAERRERKLSREAPIPLSAGAL